MTTAQFDTAAMELIEEHVRRFFDSMGFSSISVRCHLSREASSGEANETGLFVGIEAGDDGKLFIGTQGANLSSLQHLIRTVLRRQLSQPVFINVDVNGYRARRERSLMGLAETAAQRAKAQGRTVVLQPMEAADRRLIHTALAARPDVKTESLGDEPNRRVVIKPIFL